MSSLVAESRRVSGRLDIESRNRPAISSDPSCNPEASFDWCAFRRNWFRFPREITLIEQNHMPVNLSSAKMNTAGTASAGQRSFCGNVRVIMKRTHPSHLGNHWQAMHRQGRIAAAQTLTERFAQMRLR